MRGARATTLGVVSGYFSGWFDTVFQRIVDIGVALPGPISIILVATTIRDRLWYGEVTAITISSGS